MLTTKCDLVEFVRKKIINSRLCRFPNVSIFSKDATTYYQYAIVKDVHPMDVAPATTISFYKTRNSL